MDETEAAGAAVTAGATVASNERGQSAAASEGACKNCGAALSGRYCAACGQPAHIHRTLSHFGEELLHGVLHFDSKSWRTLPRLLFRPGALTRFYLDGQRQSYVSPLALFLFCIFLLFFVAEIDHSVGPAERAVERARAETVRIVESRDGQDIPITSDQFKVNTGNEWLDTRFEHALGNPELRAYKLKQVSYKFAFLLVPLALPFVALLFLWKRDVTLFDHTVFVMYEGAFICLLYVVEILLALSGADERTISGVIRPIGFAAIATHVFFHLGGAYRLGWFSALWRTLLMIPIAMAVLVLFLIVVITIGVFG